MRRKIIGLLSERRILEFDRKRVFMCLLEVKIVEWWDNEKFVIKNEFLFLDVEEIYEVDYFDIGDDG